jgi:GTP-binding protein HflX
LPHTLVASFQSTLAVAAEADLLLIVADAADRCVGDQLAVVWETLKEIGAGQIPYVLVLNKSDRVDSVAIGELRAKNPDALPISALTGDGLDRLKEEIGRQLRCPSVS